MLESKLSRQIYMFEKTFEYPYDGPSDVPAPYDFKEKLDLKVELIVDFIEDKFYLDLNQPLNIESGIILLYGANAFGNKGSKVEASAEFYRWLAEICDFAKVQLKPEKAVYDILNDKRVIDISFDFNKFMGRSKFSSGLSDEGIWNEFSKSYSYKSPESKRKKIAKGYDSESFDLDDNK